MFQLLITPYILEWNMAVGENERYEVINGLLLLWWWPLLSNLPCISLDWNVGSDE